MVTVNYYTDPLCPWSWAAEPPVRKLMVDFGDQLAWTFVMAGLERDLLDGRRAGTPIAPPRRLALIETWLAVAANSGAPLDPTIWSKSPPSTSYPACMAVLAAAHQASDSGYRYLRFVREQLLCRARKLDTIEALATGAEQAGLEPGRFGVDLRSHGTVEQFGADLDRTRGLAATGPKAKQASLANGLPIPAIVFVGDDGVDHGVFGLAPYEAYRDAAISAGARLEDPQPLSIEQALERFGSLTTAELELLCDLQGPPAGAALYGLAEQWKLRVEPILTGNIWHSV